MHRIGRHVIPLALLALLAVVSCDDDPAGPETELPGGVLATFEVSGETFRVWATSQEGVDQLLALETGESQAGIPNGPLVQGAGEDDHNAPWSWHLDPQAVRMAEVTTEVCDGRPSMVEEDLEYWLDTVGRFCPWNAELVELEDFRR